jgi:hypothetical protein
MAWSSRCAGPADKVRHVHSYRHNRFKSRVLRPRAHTKPTTVLASGTATTLTYAAAAPRCIPHQESAASAQLIAPTELRARMGLNEAKLRVAV